MAFVPGEFPAQMASNGENVSIWWHHHVNGEIEIDWLIFNVNPFLIFIH